MTKNIMHIFDKTTDTSFCGTKDGHGLYASHIRVHGKHRLYPHERLCKSCEKTYEYGMLLLETT